MFWDEEYLDDKVDELKKMIEENKFQKDKCNNFISYDELEDEFSHNEIRDGQKIFMKKVKEYLSVNYSGQFAMWMDYCVHIATVDLYRNIMWSNSNHKEDYIKFREEHDIVK